MSEHRSEHRSDHLSGDELRAAYASATAAGATHRADCPSPDALRAAVRGEGGGDPAERLRVLDRAFACPACRRELALLHAVSEPPPRGRAAWEARPWGRLASLAAAASLLVAVGVYGVGRWGGGREEVTRAAAADPALVAPAPGAALAGGPVTFVWRRVPGAFRYTLELDAADGAVLYTAQTADTALVAPLGGVAAGEHRWSVRARLDDGSERRSESRPLRLRR
jgi:hypothetical protein